MAQHVRSLPPAPSRKASNAATEPGATAALIERIYLVARQVSRGQVATYGQIALVAGAPSARIVGYAMAHLPSGSKVPWQRVINSQGQVSPRKEGSS
ncbi:MAG: MGMT family protein, partial [Kiloniellales bacterium]